MSREKTQMLPQSDVPAVPVMMPIDEPQQQQSGAGWLWLMVLLIVVAGGIYYYRNYYAGSADASKATTAPARDTPVVAAPAKKGDMKIYLTGLGTASALNTVTLHTRVDGELILVKFKEGQHVEQNEVLAEIDPRPFKVQLAQATGQKARDEAQLQDAKAILDRYNNAGTAIAKQDVATQAALVAQYTAAVTVDNAAIEQANLNLKYCEIVAPISGKIGLRLVDQGNIVHITDPGGLAVITQLQPIAVTFTLPEDDLPRIQERFRTDEMPHVVAFDRDMRNRLATGTLLAVDNQIDLTSGTIRLKASFPNLDSSLYPNQFVNARLLVQTIKDTILIPAAAVQRTPTMNYVYLVKPSGKQSQDKKPQGTVMMRPVTVGPIEGDVASVTSGLEDGDIVVTDGVDKLMPESKVVMTLMPPADPEGKLGGKKSGTTQPTTQLTTQPATRSTTPLTPTTNTAFQPGPKL